MNAYVSKDSNNIRTVNRWTSLDVKYRRDEVFKFIKSIKKKMFL